MPRPLAGAVWLICTATAIASSAPVTAQANVDSGAAFYRTCRAEVGNPQGRCETYLLGVADMLAALGNGGYPGGICGSSYGNGELSRIYVAWMPKHRNYWNLPRLAGAAIALRDKWPCRLGKRI